MTAPESANHKLLPLLEHGKSVYEKVPAGYIASIGASIAGYGRVIITPAAPAIETARVMNAVEALVFGAPSPGSHRASPSTASDRVPKLHTVDGLQWEVMPLQKYSTALRRRFAWHRNMPGRRAEGLTAGIDFISRARVSLMAATISLNTPDEPRYDKPLPVIEAQTVAHSTDEAEAIEAALREDYHVQTLARQEASAQSVPTSTYRGFEADSNTYFTVVVEDVSLAGLTARAMAARDI